MNPLFTSVEEDLKNFLEYLNPEDIQDAINATTYHKGNQYYEWNLVKDVRYSFDKNQLTALVEGSLDYNTSLTLQEGHVWASCSCPAERMCKHITALLLFATQKSHAIEVGEDRTEGSPAHQHLLQLSKEELVRLVLNYAPEELLLEIHNTQASEEEALAIYTNVEAAIRKLFENTELLHSPRDFSEALVKQTSRLSGLEYQLQERLSELIFSVIQEIESAFRRGYLYDEYNDTNFELPEGFVTLVAKHISALSFDAKISFLAKLDAVISEGAYDVFEDLSGLSLESFQENELPALKEMLLNDHENLSIPLIEEYYALVHPFLTEAEKEKILLRLAEEGSYWLLELAALYQKQGRQQEAIELIRAGLSRDADMYEQEPVYLLYLDLIDPQDPALQEVSEEAMNCCASSSILEKIAALSGKDMDRYERMLEEKNPQGMLEYLEKQGRLSEALSLLKRHDTIWDHLRYAFFKKHKKDFPEEAKTYFSGVIEKNLPYTGNNHYHTIAEALRQIRQLDEQQAAAIAADIRTNYAQRSNLMNLLAEA